MRERHHRRAAVLAALLASTLAFPAGASAQATLPRSLAGMPIQNEMTGSEAAHATTRLHGRSVSGGEDSIGHYGQGAGHLMLYASRFADPEAALAKGAAMAARVAGAGTGFGHHRTFDAGGVNVHFVLGEGKAHYFYAQDRTLYWLASPPDTAPAALAELLGVDGTTVPELERLLSGNP